MATTFFPTVTASTRTSSTWTGTFTPKQLSLSRGSGAVTVTDNTTTGMSSGVSPAASGGQVAGLGSGGVNDTVDAGDPGTGSAWGLVWLTEPLSAVTVSGSITVNLRGLESNAMANYGMGAEVFKVASGNGAAVQFGFNANTTELGTTEAARSVTITPTSTAFSNGDMLAVWIYWCSAGGTSASGFTASGFYGGASGATGDCFFTFTEAITEQAVAAASLIWAPSLATQGSPPTRYQL